MTPYAEPAHHTDPFLKAGPIAAWAGSHGLDAHTGLALAACTLAHVAGHALMYQGSNGLSGMRPPSLLGLESDLALRAAFASLTAPIAAIQQSLILKARQHDPADIEAAMTEVNRLHLNVANDFEGRRGSRGRPEDEFASDTRIAGRTTRYEALKRPLMMMENSLPADLGKALTTFHFGRAFLAGGVERLPREERRRSQRLDQIARYLQGAEIPPSTKSHAPQERLTGSIGGILLLPDFQFEEVYESHRAFLGSLVPVASDPTTLLPARVDPVEVDAFLRMFSRELHTLIASRRAFAAAHGRFVDPEWAARYMATRRDFLRECSTLPGELRSPAIVALPDLIAWALFRLSGGDIAQETVLAWAFATARHLRHRAMCMFQTRDQAREAAKRQKIAERLIRRLLQVGPCKRRKLVRGCDDMRQLVNEPVIRVLVQIGVFVETEDKTLTIGRLPSRSLSPSLFIETPTCHEP